MKAAKAVMRIKRIKSIPNVLTVMRLALTPVVLILMSLPEDHRILATIIYAVAGCTDFVDGYVARKYTVISSFGKCFDPIADKIFVILTLATLLSMHEIPLLPSLVIISREIVVSGLREYLGQKGQSIPVSWLAKSKTFLQIFSIGLYVLTFEHPLFPGSNFMAPILLWTSALLSVYTAIEYFKIAKGELSKF